MNSEQFWKIVNGAASVSTIGNRQTLSLRGEIEKLSEKELIEFEDAFNGFFNAACTSGLWDAATIILGECTEKKFEEFRGWLIKQGQAAFEVGIANPDDLAPFVKDTPECLRTLGLAKELHAAKSKQPFMPNVARAPNTIASLRTPREELPAKYPNLNKAFPYLERSLKRTAAARAAPPPMTVTAQMLEGPKLTREEFWRLMDDCRPPASYLDEQKMIAALMERFLQMPFSSLVSFQNHVDQLMAESYKASLWEVAIVVLGGCSEDSFAYVRGWLIALGKNAYDRILADPERIVDHIEAGDEPGCQTILTVASTAFSQRTYGAELPREPYGALKLERRMASENQLAKSYPSLWQRFR